MKLFKIYFYCLLFISCYVVTSTKEFGTALEERQKRRIYFQKKELVYGSEAFELMSQYPENDRNIEFLFGDELSKDSAYFQVEGKRLYSKQVGQEKVTARVFHDNKLTDEIQSLLKVLPKRLTILLGDRTAGLAEVSTVQLTTEFVGLNLAFQAEPSEGIIFYSYEKTSNEWRENSESFLCETFLNQACSFQIKAVETNNYIIKIVSKDKNIIFDPPIVFFYNVDFSYPSFKFNATGDMQPLAPQLLHDIQRFKLYLSVSESAA